MTSFYLGPIKSTTSTKLPTTYFRGAPGDFMKEDVGLGGGMEKATRCSPGEGNYNGWQDGESNQLSSGPTKPHHPNLMAQSGSGP